MAKTTVSIEDVPLNGFHQLLTVRSGGGWLMDGYVLSIIGVAMVQFSAALHLTSFWEGMVAASALLGIFVGGFLGGWLTDRMGRRRPYFFGPVLFIVCSIAQFWVQSGEALPSMRVFMMGGDKIPTDLPDRMRPLAPGAAIWSVGGPTETSIISNWYPIGAVDPIWTTIPYGRAMPNQKMLVLDQGLNHCPPFMPGRIFMGGACLARGSAKDCYVARAHIFSGPACCT